jgi:hypothetical protein
MPDTTYFDGGVSGQEISVRLTQFGHHQVIDLVETYDD